MEDVQILHGFAITTTNLGSLSVRVVQARRPEMRIRIELYSFTKL